MKKEVASRLAGLGLPAAEHCIVVSVDQQKLWHFQGEACSSYAVSTARAGVGSVLDSQQTPLGLHRICECLGTDAPAGMVFKARQATGKLAAEWPTPEDNLITSRILWLDGMEVGKNKGIDVEGRVVDTRSRFIYIHGTNQNAKLGTPNSHGCVLLSDQDIIRLFAETKTGVPVLILS